MNINTTTTTTTTMKSPEAIPKETMSLLTLFIKIILSGGFGLFGVISNIINVIIFYRQGIMANSSNVIFTGLAISDLWVCILGVWASILAIFYTYLDISRWSWNVYSFSAFTAARALNLVTQFTCLITTLMAVERAVSVTFPFKVKAIFTPKRSLITVVSIFVLITIIHIPNLFQMVPSMGYSEFHNITRIDFNINVFSDIYLTVYNWISPTVLRFATLFVVFLCNMIIFWKVSLSQKFRQTKGNATTKSSSSDEDQADNKEMKLLRMITIISVVFCFCYFWNIVQISVLYLWLDFGVDYHWTLENITWDAAMFLQIFNSSINIVIYYNMSGRFRQELRNLFKM